MNPLVLYIIKSGIALSLFYILYWTLLRYGTHFKLNRFILLSSLFFSFLLPFISFDFLLKVEPTLPTFTIDFNGSSTQQTVFSVANNAPLSIWQILKTLYLIGSLVVVARLIYQAWSIRVLEKKSVKTTYQGVTIIVVSSDITPFSYFNKIFIPSTKFDHHSIESVIEHERSHLQQFHLLDLILMEAAIVVQWFNPFIWLYEQSFREIHEYLADDAVLKKGVNQGKYQALLVNEAIGGPIFAITNQFNQSLIKKRIIMMTKMKTPKKATLKALLFVPLILVLMLSFASQKNEGQAFATSSIGNEEITIHGKIVELKTSNPIDGVHVTVEGSTIGTTADSKGNYSIKVPKVSALVFSHIGHVTVIFPTSTILKVTGNLKESFDLMLEPETYNINFSLGNQMIPDYRKDMTQVNNKTNKNEPVFVVVEENPSYPGGTNALLEFIKTNLKYPDAARKAKIEGTVMATFTITAEGKTTNCKIVRSVNPLLDQEALRIVGLFNNWNPGKQNGKAVKCMVNIPIEFTK